MTELTQATEQKDTAIECLTRIKNYIGKQYADIPTWESSETSKAARLDELQCMDTLVSYMLAKQTDSLDSHYDVMYGDKPERRVFYINVGNDESIIKSIKDNMKLAGVELKS